MMRVAGSLILAFAPALAVDAATSCYAVVGAAYAARFAWPPVAGSDRYILCVATDVEACSDKDGPTAGPTPAKPAAGVSELTSDGAVDRAPGRGPLWLVVAGPSAQVPGATLERPALLEAFAGEAVVWTAAACSGDACAYLGKTCTLEVPEAAQTPPKAPTLVEPVDLEVVSALEPLLSLSWKESAGALAYRICAGSQSPRELAVACASGDATLLGEVAGAAASVELPAEVAVAGTLVHWTVAACNRVGCSWSPAGRRVSLSATPPAPELLAPAAGARLESPAPELSWRRVAAADSYKVCMMPLGVSCESPRARVYDVAAGDRTAFIPPTPVLPGRPVAWTVAACVNGRCRYAWPPNRFEVAGLSAPTLVSPGDGAHIALPTVRFSWEPSAAADSYMLCAYDIDEAASRRLDARTACDTAGLATRMRTAETSAEMTLGGAGSGATRYGWMVGACHSQSSDGCIYPSRPRRLDVEAEYSVRLRIESIEIHADCDRESPGDWVLSAVPFVGGRERERLVWPPGVRSVSDGDRLPVDRELVVSGVRAQSTVALVVSAVDCDGDALHAYTIVLGERLAGGPEVLRVGVDCSTVTNPEMSGESEDAGVAVIELSAEEWLAGGLHSVQSTGGECDAGGGGAFTAHVVVESTAEARPALPTSSAAVVAF